MADRPQEIQVHHIHHPKNITDDPKSRYPAYPSYPAHTEKNGPSTSQVMALVTLLPVGGILLALAGIIFTVSLIGLALTTPLFIIFSPILVPAAIAIGLAMLGFLASGTFGVTALSSLSWIINYMRGTIANMPDKLEYARQSIQEAAGQVGQKAKDVGYEVSQKAKDVGHEVGQKAKDVGQGIQSKAHEADRGYEGGAGRAHEGGGGRAQDIRGYYGRPQYGTVSGGEDRYRGRGPSTSQVVAFVTLFPIGGILLVLSGIIMTITVIGLASSAPLFVIFSPVLVPAAIAICLVMTGLLTSGAFGLTGVSSLAWFFNYLRGKARDMPEDVDYVKLRLAEAAEQVGQTTKDVGQTIQDKAREAEESARTKETGRTHETGRTLETGRTHETGRKEGGKT